MNKDEFGRKLHLAIQNAVFRIGAFGVEQARATTKFKHSTSFDNQITFQPAGSSSGWVISGAPHSYWLEYGNNQNGPRIYPVRAQALRFVIDGEVIFRKWVRSHGPYDFMLDAQKATEKAGKKILEEELSKIVW